MFVLSLCPPAYERVWMRCFRWVVAKWRLALMREDFTKRKQHVIRECVTNLIPLLLNKELHDVVIDGHSAAGGGVEKRLEHL